MKRPHAVEVTLTRPATDAEVDDLAGRAPGRYAFAHDRRRATTVVTAVTEAAAAGFVFWQTAGHGLPVDAVWSLYPDRDGFVRLVFELDGTVAGQLRRRAEQVGRDLDEFTSESVREAVEQDLARCRSQLGQALRQLVAQSSAEDLRQVLLGQARSHP